MAEGLRDFLKGSAGIESQTATNSFLLRAFQFIIHQSSTVGTCSIEDTDR